MTEHEEREGRDEHGARFWIGVVVGGAVMAYGVFGLLDESAATHPRSLAIWIVGADLLHDLVIAPIVCVVAYLVGRIVREPWRTPVRAGVVITGVVLVVAWPGLRGYGRDRVPDNDSVQPLNYATATATVLVAVWVGVVAWALWRVARQRAAARSAQRQPA